jgi:ankyrin repeat protein
MTSFGMKNLPIHQVVGDVAHYEVEATEQRVSGIYSIGELRKADKISDGANDDEDRSPSRRSSSVKQSGRVPEVKLKQDPGLEVSHGSKSGGKSPSSQAPISTTRMPGETDKLGEPNFTPLYIAARNGHDSIVKFLLEQGADINDGGYPAPSTWSPLCGAAMHGHLSTVKLLLDQGANIHAASETNHTAIQAASKAGHPDIVNLLIQRGANASACDEERWTCLQAASKYGHEDVVKLLLDNGADVHARDREGWTSISTASKAGQVRIVDLLLQHGADPSVGDWKNWTPLHTASKHNRKDVVKLLLEWGADVNAKHISGKTPLIIAVTEGREAIVRLLTPYQTAEPPPSYESSIMGSGSASRPEIVGTNNPNARGGHNQQ